MAVIIVFFFINLIISLYLSKERGVAFNQSVRCLVASTAFVLSPRHVLGDGHRQRGLLGLRCCHGEALISPEAFC